MAEGWCLPGCGWALGQGTSSGLRGQTDGDSPMGCLAQAGQTRLSWLAPGRMAPWPAWPVGSRPQDVGVLGGHPPLLSLGSPFRNEGRSHGRTRVPESPHPPSLRTGAARSWQLKKGCGREQVYRGRRPPTKEQPQREPFILHLRRGGPGTGDRGQRECPGGSRGSVHQGPAG